MSGNASDDVVRKARAASFDERLALLGVLLDYVTTDIREAVDRVCYIEELLNRLMVVKGSSNISVTLEEEERKCQISIDRLEVAGSLSSEKKQLLKKVRSTLNEMLGVLSNNDERTDKDSSEMSDDNGFAIVKSVYDRELDALKALEKTVGGRLEALFRFVEDVFGDGQEMLVLVSELTENSYSAKYISMFGCSSYSKYSEKLMVSDRKTQLDKKIKMQEKHLGQLEM